MKTQNMYPDMPEFIVGLVKSTARKIRGGSTQDREDNEQELMLYIWRHTQQNPAMKDITEDSVKALIAAYINLKKKELCRKQRALSEKGTLYSDIYDQPGERIEDAIAIKFDIRNATEKLSEQEQKIISMLYSGFGLSKIAEEMGISPAAVHCHIVHIRKTFKREGLASHLEF